MLRKIFIIFFILVLLALGAYAFVYFTNKKAADSIMSTVVSVQNYFPFGQGPSTVPAPTDTSSDTNTTPQEPGVPVAPPRLRQIYSSPVAGAGAFTIASTTVIRFVERTTGNLYEARTDLDIVERISNTTVPKVSEALFTQPEIVVLRYLTDGSDVIETLHGSLATSSTSTSTPRTPTQLTTTYLSPNILGFVLSPAKTKAFSLIQSGSGTAGLLSNPNGTGQTPLFSSPIREWIPQWPKTDTITLTTKASAQATGYLYFVNTSTGAMRGVLGGIYGLSTITNPTTTKVLYSQANQTATGIVLRIYDTSSKATATITSGATIADKCVWGTKNTDVVYCAMPKEIPNAAYPDAWYKGQVSFNDTLWRIDTTTGNAQLLADITAISKRDVDAFNMSLDPTERFLVFMNKKDLTLWSYDLLQ